MRDLKIKYILKNILNDFSIIINYYSYGLQELLSLKPNLAKKSIFIKVLVLFLLFISINLIFTIKKEPEDIFYLFPGFLCFCSIPSPYLLEEYPKFNFKSYRDSKKYLINIVNQLNLIYNNHNISEYSFYSDRIKEINHRIDIFSKTIKSEYFNYIILIFISIFSSIIIYLLQETFIFSFKNFQTGVLLRLDLLFNFIILALFFFPILYIFTLVMFPEYFLNRFSYKEISQNKINLELNLNKLREIIFNLEFCRVRDLTSETGLRKFKETLKKIFLRG